MDPLVDFLLVDLVYIIGKIENMDPLANLLNSIRFFLHI